MNIIAQADATCLPLADKSVDLVIGSPPYCDARLYLEDGENLGISRDCVEWVDWMLEVTTEALRVSKGAVIWVAAGVTRDRNYWPACEGLMWEWYRRGGSMYRPCYWRRVGIPGSGHNDWFRADVEYCMCFKRPGPLPWSDNTAMGHPPKYAPGGDPTNRLANGKRASEVRDELRAKGVQVGGRTSRTSEGERRYRVYVPPDKANPGNMINTGAAGSGRLGDRMTHENEAPFPERIPEWFIRSLCPPDGIVCDPFSGSGTTAKVAKSLGRQFAAFDLRESQCKLTRRRTKTVQRDMFTA